MPARFNCESSSLKPNGSMRCKTDFVAAHNRATLPVFGGISGSTRTIFIDFCHRGTECREFIFLFALCLCVSVPLRLIKNFPQNQTVRRCRHAGHTPVAAC